MRIGPVMGWVAALTLCSLAGCASKSLCGSVAMPGEKTGAARAGVAAGVPQELLEQAWLFELVRYLYRWHLSEEDIEKLAGEKRVIFQVKAVAVKLDEGDKSQQAQIVLPQVGVRVGLKKADYVIEETGVAVKSDRFKVIEMRRGMGTSGPQGYRVVEVETQAMLDYLFKTRGERDFVEPEVVEKMRVAVREEAAKEKVLPGVNIESPVVHLAPLSPVANETWVYWEAGRKLFYFASDSDLGKAAVWEQHALRVRIYDLDQQVVLSHEEAPGSNRFLTRYEASRAIYNCMVLGEQVTLPTYAGAATQPRR
jgi:hypothetical protein